MKTAIFEFGKKSLAEWIENNRNCEKMVLVGEVGYDQLFGLNSIGKDFCPVEFDITDMHLIDYQSGIDIEVFPIDKQEGQPSLVQKMLANSEYGTRQFDLSFPIFFVWQLLQYTFQ